MFYGKECCCEAAPAFSDTGNEKMIVCFFCINIRMDLFNRADGMKGQFSLARITEEMKRHTYAGIFAA